MAFVIRMLMEDFALVPGEKMQKKSSSVEIAHGFSNSFQGHEGLGMTLILLDGPTMFK